MNPDLRTLPSLVMIDLELARCKQRQGLCEEDKLKIYLYERKLRERIKFAQSIHRLNKCHLNDEGEIICKHELINRLTPCGKSEWKRLYHFDYPYQKIEHPLLGIIIACMNCDSLMFKGNKSWKS